MSLSPDGRLYDYVGGQADLRRRRIRFIGDPATRIAEDYLRVLRFFRSMPPLAKVRSTRQGLRAAILARDISSCSRGERFARNC